MVPSRVLSRGVPRLLATSGRSSVLLRRFVASVPLQAQETETPVLLINAQMAAPEKSDKPRENSNKIKRPYNRKVREISVQVKRSIAGAGTELADAIEIFEEGISYLREVQQAEKIPDDMIYSLFQPVIADLFDKLFEKDIVLESHTPSLVLDMLVKYKVAHTFHFWKLAEAALHAHPNQEGYAEVLQLWIRRLEYVKEVGFGRMNELVNQPFMVYQDRNYNQHDFRNLTYFSYVMHCLDSGTEYNMKDVMKILQVEDPTQVPDKFYVARALEKLLEPKLKEAASKFTRQITELNVKAMDPNSAYVTRRIASAVNQKDARNLTYLYEQMKNASLANELPISELTLNRVMNGFIEVHRFDEASEIFRKLLEMGTPSRLSWILMIKAMSHTSKVKDMTKDEKAQTVSNVENTINTMISSGVEVNARVLASVLGAFANLDRFDLVDEYMKKYSELPVVHVAWNNILIGMLINKHIGNAEAAFKEYTAKDESYTPSTAVMNGFLSHYANTGNQEAVAGIIKYMREHDVEEDFATITTFISYYFKLYRLKGKVPDINALLVELKDKVPYNDAAATTIIDGLAKDGMNIEAARTMYDHFCARNSRLKYSMGLLTSMMKCEVEYGSVVRAENMFEEYIGKLRNETRVWNMMIKALLPKQEELAIRYYTRLLDQKKFKVTPNYFTYYFMLDHFNKAGNKARVQWLLDEISTSEMTDFGKTLPRMIYSMRNEYLVPRPLLEKVKPIGK